MKVTFDIKLSAKDIFKFNMYQAYRGMQGLISTLIPLVIIGTVIWKYNDFGLANALLYIGMAIVLVIYLPASLWLRSNRAIKTNEALAKPLHYEFSEENICVSQEDQNVEFQWENIYKMIATKSMVLIYTNRMNAYIIPREQMQEQYVDLATLAQSQLAKFRVKMKK